MPDRDGKLPLTRVVPASIYPTLVGRSIVSSSKSGIYSVVTFFDNLLRTFAFQAGSKAPQPALMSLVLGGFLVALATARPVSAEMPTAAIGSGIVAASLGQSSSSNVDRKRESDDLIKRARAARERLTLGEQELAQSRERFRAGVAGNADVITAQLNLDAARSQYIDALAAHELARVSLARAQGHLLEMP